MIQSTFSSFSVPQTALPVFDCGNCRNQRGLSSIEGKPKVKCFGKLKDVPQNGCPSWSGGNDLAAMLAFAPPDDFVAKKWAGGRA